MDDEVKTTDMVIDGDQYEVWQESTQHPEELGFQEIVLYVKEK